MPNVYKSNESELLAMSCKKFRRQVLQYLLVRHDHKNSNESIWKMYQLQTVFATSLFYYGWSIRCSIAKEAKNGKVEKLVLVGKRASWHLLTFEFWSIDDDNVDTRP